MGSARAAERYAIVIGSNSGEPDEPRLNFAERDAQRVADVLTRLGGVDAANLLLLLSPSASQLGKALEVFRQRVAPRGTDGSGAMVFVYYSGHADSNALHLSGTRMPFATLKASTRAIGTDLAVFLIDACRSGGILRTKGATPTEPFEFVVEDALVAEGTAIITSSAEDEDAQESERLEGGIFTHHLVAGLLGAADTSDDARVSLAEAYRYAYTQTLATTSSSSVVQHPTYAFEVKGRKEIVLTTLDLPSGRGRLELSSAGHYLVFERFGGHEIVAELEARAGTRLSLPHGTYLVRRREATAAYEREVTLRPDGLVELAKADMTQVPFRSAVRKGYGLRAKSAWSFGAGFDVAGAVLAGTGANLLGSLMAQLDFADIALQLRLRYGRNLGSENDLVAESHGLLGVDLGLYHLFDLGPHGLGFGLRGGIDWLAQRFVSNGDTPPVDQVCGRIGPMMRLELALGGSVTLTMDAGFEAYFVSLAPEPGTDERASGGDEVHARVVPSANLGLAFFFE